MEAFIEEYYLEPEQIRAQNPVFFPDTEEDSAESFSSEENFIIEDSLMPETEVKRSEEEKNNANTTVETIVIDSSRKE